MVYLLVVTHAGGLNVSGLGRLIDELWTNLSLSAHMPMSLTSAHMPMWLKSPNLHWQKNCYLKSPIDMVYMEPIYHLTLLSLQSQSLLLCKKSVVEPSYPTFIGIAEDWMPHYYLKLFVLLLYCTIGSTTTCRF